MGAGVVAVGSAVASGTTVGGAAASSLEELHAAVKVSNTRMSAIRFRQNMASFNHRHKPASSRQECQLALGSAIGDG